MSCLLAVEFHPEARAELLQERAWYRERSEQAALGWPLKGSRAGAELRYGTRVAVGLLLCSAAGCSPTSAPPPVDTAVGTAADAVASHPQVADLWAVLPTMAGGDYLYCADERGGWNTAFMPATAQLECDYPWPLLVQGTANGFTSVATRGPPNMFGATSPVSYPVGRVSSAVWSDLDIPDDSSACGLGSYLVVGTLGQGTWRGEFTW